MATTLAISHNLFLNYQERYDWYNGKEIEVIGVSMPVWFADGTSSEPGHEVFTKYKLLTSEDKALIQHNKELFYEIHMPKCPPKPYMKLPEEVWASLTPEEQEAWYVENEPTQSITNILDIKDGGSEWLAFRQYGKVRKEKATLNVVHFVEIKPIEQLLASIN